METMTEAMPHVLVLMTTYNGERYLREQVASVLAQQGVQVTLRVRDDCSSDATWQILKDLAAADPRIQIARNEPNLGCIRNFMGLVYGVGHEGWKAIGREGVPAPVPAHTSYDFIAICDQDDEWLPNKLRHAADALGAAAAMPARQPGESPVYPAGPATAADGWKAAAASQTAMLYYAGVNNVDAQGKTLGNEYAPYRACADKYGSLLLVQNWCLGCTTLMNGALVRQLQEHPVYDFVRMYDAWIHAVALYCGGRVVCDLENTYINRRITGSNTVGVMNEKRSITYLLRKGLAWALEKDQEAAAKHTGLAVALLREYEGAMSGDTAQLVRAVATRETSAASRRFLAGRKDICMTTALRTQWLRSMVRLNRF